MFKKRSVAPPVRQRQVVRSTTERSATVFSYHASRAVRPVTAPRGQAPPVTAASVKRHNTQRKWLRRTPLMIAAAVLLVVTLINLPVGHQPLLELDRSGPGQALLQPEVVYQQAVQHQLASSILNTNKLTFDKAKTGASLLAQFTELQAVEIHLPLLGTRPTVRLTPATPALVLVDTANQAYVVAATGRVLMPASRLPGLLKLNLPVVTDGSGLPIKTGRTVLPSTTVAFITEVVGQLSAKQLVAESLTLPGGTSELDLKVRGNNYLVKFNLQGSARAEAGTYLATKKYLDTHGKTPSSYIDVRIDGRAYYK